jgi:DNA modification methylase
MNKINDINLEDWKNSDVWTDSLWIIEERDKSGKHDGFYHGNFVPQVPRQLIKKYTKEEDVVLDLFLGSGDIYVHTPGLAETSKVGLENSSGEIFQTNQ